MNCSESGKLRMETKKLRSLVRLALHNNSYLRVWANHMQNVQLENYTLFLQNCWDTSKFNKIKYKKEQVKRLMGRSLRWVSMEMLSVACSMMGVGAPSGWPTTSVVGWEGVACQSEWQQPVLVRKRRTLFCQILFRQTHSRHEGGTLPYLRAAWSLEDEASRGSRSCLTSG